MRLIIISLLMVVVTEDLSRAFADDFVIGDSVTCIEDTEVKRGTRVTGRIPKGTVLTVDDVNATWLLVQTEVGKNKVDGWIPSSIVAPALQWKFLPNTKRNYQLESFSNVEERPKGGGLVVLREHLLVKLSLSVLQVQNGKADIEGEVSQIRYRVFDGLAEEISDTLTPQPGNPRGQKPLGDLLRKKFSLIVSSEGEATFPKLTPGLQAAFQNPVLQESKLLTEDAFSESIHKAFFRLPQPAQKKWQITVPKEAARQITNFEFGGTIQDLAGTPLRECKFSTNIQLVQLPPGVKMTIKTQSYDGIYWFEPKVGAVQSWRSVVRMDHNLQIGGRVVDQDITLMTFGHMDLIGPVAPPVAAPAPAKE